VKIFAISDTEWYPKYSLELFQNSTTKLDFVSHPRDADLIWHYSYYIQDQQVTRRLATVLDRKFTLSRIPTRRFRTTPLVASIHHLDRDKRPVWQQTIRGVDKNSDFVHYFSKSNALTDCQLFSKPIFWAPYWIDLRLFSPLSDGDRRDLKTRLGLPLDRTIVGSFQRDTESDLVSPKREKGPDRFAEILENLDREEVFVLLAGPRRQYIERRLRSARVEFLSVGEVPYNEMPSLYGAVDVYLVTSRVEGGPQAVLECMATKTPILSSNVGIAGYLDESAIKTQISDYVCALRSGYPDVLDKHLRTVQAFSCEKVVPIYEEIFQKIVNGGQIESGLGGNTTFAAVRK